MEKNKGKKDLNKFLYVVVSILACIFIFVMSAVVSRVIVQKNVNTSSLGSSNTQIKEYAEQEKKKEDNYKERERVIEQLQSNNVSEEEKIEIAKQYTEKVKEEKLTDEYKEYEKLTEEEKADIAVIPRKYEVDVSEFDKIKEYQDEHEEENKNNKGKIKDNTNQTEPEDNKDNENQLPSKFTLKEIIDLKVENQGSKGLCWDYAGLNSVETYLYLKTGKLYDFSEHYVDYMTSNNAYASFGRSLASGGDFSIIKSFFNENQSIVEEKDLEKCEYDEQQFHGFGEVKGEKIIITKTAVFPSFSKKDTSKEEFDKYNEIIKTHIMNYGSVWCSMISSSSTYIYRESYEDRDAESAGHAVSIIGWDDNIPKEKFKNANGHMPENDGGYIIFNSWGSWYGEGGYGYISYEDYNAFSGLYGILSINKMEDMVKVSDLKSPEIIKAIRDNAKSFITVIDNVEYINVSNVSVLNLKNTNISDISDLKYFTNLGYLDLSNTNVSNIDVLKDAYSLWYLNLGNTNVKDVSCLEKTNLKSLYLKNNTGIKGYEKLTKLADISMRNCGLENVEISDMCKDLYYVELSENPIKSVKFSNKDKERYLALYLDNCNISDLSNISFDNNYVKYVSLKNNAGLSNIETITKIANDEIVNIDLTGCNVTDISCLKKFKKIDCLELCCNANLSGDLSGVQIGEIDLTDCNITDKIPLSNIKGLMYLILAKNDVNVEKLMDELKEMANNDQGLTVGITKENAETYSKDNIKFFYSEGYLDNNRNYDDYYMPEQEISEKNIINKTLEVRSLNNNTYIYPNEVFFKDKIEYLQSQSDDDYFYIYIEDSEINGNRRSEYLNKKVQASSVNTLAYVRYNEEFEKVKVIFNVVENSSLKPEKLYVTPMKNKFNSLSDVNLSDSFVQIGYGSGVYETVTDFEIINNSDYKVGLNTVTFKKDDLEYSINIYINENSQNSGTFTIQFKEGSTLIYDVAESQKEVVYSRDFQNNTLQVKWDELFEPWYISVRVESIPELVELSKTIQIKGVGIKYSADYDQDDYYINKIDEEELEVFNQLPNLQEIRIETIDVRKNEEDYIDNETKEKIEQKYDYIFFADRERMKISFNYESDLYHKCIDALPSEFIFDGQEQNTGNYVISILWSEIKEKYGNNPEVKLELSGLVELRNLDSRYPASEITLHLEDILDDNDCEYTIRELKNMTTLKKLILVDSNSDKKLSDYLSKKFVKEMSEYFEIEYRHE